jgi:two-component system CheB/CheR fusion protein
MKIVLVDDNDDLRTMVGFLLRGLGHDVMEATEGMSGLTLLRSERPELAIIDIGLPNLDGHQLVRQFRAEEHPDQRAYIVAYSGYGDEANRRKAQSAGFDIHLVKPVPLSVLKQIVTDRAVALHAP